MKVALAAVTGAVVGALFARRRGSVETVTPQDERAEELRRKLAEAREATADEDDFEAAGMGAETLVEEPPPPPPPEHVAEPEPKAKPKPKSPARKAQPAAETPQAPETAETPPADEFEAMRRRIHEEGRAAADEMRRSADPPEKT